MVPSQEDIMQFNKAIKDYLTQQEIISPFVTKLFYDIGQEVRSQDTTNILLPIQSTLAALRKSWVVCPNNDSGYASIFFYYIDAQIWWPFAAEEPVLSIYHRVGGWPAESALIICGTNPRAFPDITDEFLAIAKRNMEAEIEEFITYAAQEGEPYQKGERVAFKEFLRLIITNNSHQDVARQIVQLGKRVQREILSGIESSGNEIDDKEMLVNIITASMASQSDL
jgi:hypothetical protein